MIYDSKHPAIIKGVEFRFPEGTTLTEIRAAGGFGEYNVVLKTPDREYKFSYEVTPGDCIFDEVDSKRDFDDARLKAWCIFFREYIYTGENF